MSLATYAASAPPGVLLLPLLEIMHPTWAEPLRYSPDTRDWTVTVDGEEVTFPSTGLEGAGGGSDDSGVDERGFRVPDPDLVLWRRIEALIGYLDPGTGRPVPIVVTLRAYLTSDLTEPETVVVLDLADPRLERNRSISFTATTANVMNRGAPTSRYTLQNAPGLRR